MKTGMISIFILSILLFSGCDKNSTEPEKKDPSHPDELVGSWNELSARLDVVITSKIAQKVANFYSEANGSIIITGDQQTELKYLIIGREDDGTLMVIAATIPDLFNYTASDFPVYFLMFRQASEPTVMFQAMLSETEAKQYSSAATNINYDLASYALTANNLQLVATDPGVSISANGTLSNLTVDLPANTPTTGFSIEDERLQTSVINFSVDGKFSRTTTYNWGTENSTGTWEVSDGNKLTVIETYVDLHEQTVTETTSGTFSLSTANELTINFEKSIPEIFKYDCESESACLRQFEADFFLENESLTAVKIKGTYLLSKR